LFCYLFRLPCAGLFGIVLICLLGVIDTDILVFETVLYHNEKKFQS
jgi:hypothetical protein